MEKLLIRPSEAAEVLGIGRTKIYELIARGEVPSVRVGSVIRVPLEDLRLWVQGKAQAAARVK